MARPPGPAYTPSSGSTDPALVCMQPSRVQFRVVQDYGVGDRINYVILSAPRRQPEAEPPRLLMAVPRTLRLPRAVYPTSLASVQLYPTSFASLQLLMYPASPSPPCSCTIYR